jgi:stage II sporulation protein M
MLPAIIMGTVPFFLGTLFCTYSTVHSLVIAFKYIISSLPIETILAGTIPHGIFEIPAIIFSMILSAIISKEITLAILSFVTKKKFDNPKSILYRNGLKETSIFAVETIILILIPLVFLGALTEAFVTGRILENFI